MSRLSISFKAYLISRENRIWLFWASIVSVVYFITLRSIYPIPSYYSDSYTWVGAAATGQPVTFRPIGYSKALMFFRLLSTSDIALVAGQFFSNAIVNLFLFFTANYFLRFKKVLKWFLFVLLIINPFYLFYSNYVSSDPFFNCLTVLWFTLLIWILHKPSWFLIITQLLVLFALFELRYNAIFFPAISTIALLLSKQSVVRKTVSIASSFVLIAVIIFATTIVTKNYTGTKTFSAFSGWQLANNALHVMQHDNIDTSTIKDKAVKALVGFNVKFFDTAKQTFPDSGATAVFMWHISSPLKKYMNVYPGRSNFYFKTWNALGPVYNNFGRTVILQKPFTYIKHFVLPNVKAFMLPPLEMYETYMENGDTIARVAQRYYRYKSNKSPQHYPTIYAAVFKPMQYLSIIVNFIYILCCAVYIVSGKYKNESRLYNKTLLCLTAFYIANFFFIVLLAPSVMRYNVFIATLSFPILLYLLQQLFSPLHAERASEIDSRGSYRSGV